MADIIDILNGPNLNLLGRREPAIYGRETLADIERSCLAWGSANSVQIRFRQTSDEGQLVDWIHQAGDQARGIILNAAAYSHTSIAVLDALRGVGLAVVEVHISNVYRRETFRHHSLVSGAALGVICGFGGNGYLLALDALRHHLSI